MKLQPLGELPITLRDLSVEPQSFSDEDLVILARADAWASETLVRRYRSWIKMRARSYFLVGGDQEDLVQEGLIGLFEAMRDYKEDRQVSFRSFAELCVTRQMLTAIRMATRNKHTPLNRYVPLNEPHDGGDTSRGEFGLGTRADFISITSRGGDPLEIMLNAEDLAHLISTLEEVLSNLESEVLLLYLEGRRYQEIAERLGCQIKSIDNALQRVKRKTTLALSLRAEAVPA